MLRIICREDWFIDIPSSEYKSFEVEAPEVEMWIRRAKDPLDGSSRSIVGVEIVEVPNDNG